jgi:glycosyltransferase involved in cell wall biosynthesis
VNDHRLRLSLDVTAVPVHPAGAGRYTVELVGALSARQDIDLVLTARSGDGERWRQLTEGRGALSSTRAPDRRPLRLLWEQLRFPSVIEGLHVDVHHGPHYTMPERARVPVVVTVHDCTFFDHPEWHERSKVLLFRRAIKVAARRASAVVCVSRTTADRFAEICNPRVPVVVAPHGVDLDRFRPEEPVAGTDAALLAGMGLPTDRPLIVFVGTIEPRKGVTELVAAFERVAPSFPDALLVIAGLPGWGAEAEIGAASSSARVVRTGYVDDEAVPALLRRATAVAYPALVEGYGLPALEALACGSPLVTTSGTAMAEMADGAALLVPPGDVGALADALAAMLAGDDPATAERRRRGLDIAAGRTWERSAELHMAAYRAAIGGG